MRHIAPKTDPELERQETREWLDSLDYVIQEGGPERTTGLLDALQQHARQAGVTLPFTANTPYVNTIPAEDQVPLPGNREIERRIKSLIRWNAMAMVVKANKRLQGIGGHISTYASAATLYEVGFNHFFRGQGAERRAATSSTSRATPRPASTRARSSRGGSSPKQLENFRRELRPEGGLSSYPHPWLMPDFWEFPTVSMGLGPITAIYQARFMRYLEDRGLKPPSDSKVWAFLGDGETDEPEALGAITLASREQLDNLIFVINCNLQRLDGPVRGNGKIIQELEAAFRGAGWNVIKVIWGGDWDPLLANDHDGLLVQRMGEVVDGEYQKYTVESRRLHPRALLGRRPAPARRWSQHLTDEQLWRLRLRRPRPARRSTPPTGPPSAHRGAPTVILARTIKGYGLGEAGEGKNITHQQKKLNEDELRAVPHALRHPDLRRGDRRRRRSTARAEDSPEMQYLRERRQALGGYVPSRTCAAEPIQRPARAALRGVLRGHRGARRPRRRWPSCACSAKLLRDTDARQARRADRPGRGAHLRHGGAVPPGRHLLRTSARLYEPVDTDSLLYYKEAKDGQILEEGITEAGSLSSFIAAGTAYATTACTRSRSSSSTRCSASSASATSSGPPATRARAASSLGGDRRAHDARRRGAAAPGRPQPRARAAACPTSKSYDPAFAYEIAVIVHDGIRRMYVEQESVFYYLTVHNENYREPPMPEGAARGHPQGHVPLPPRVEEDGEGEARAQLLGSGAILNEALRGAEAARGALRRGGRRLERHQLQRAARATPSTVERWNMLHPAEPARVPYMTAVPRRTRPASSSPPPTT